MFSGSLCSGVEGGLRGRMDLLPLNPTPCGILHQESVTETSQMLRWVCEWPGSGFRDCHSQDAVQMRALFPNQLGF